jgi:hypothetical protein
MKIRPAGAEMFHADMKISLFSWCTERAYERYPSAELRNVYEELHLEPSFVNW